MKKLISLFLLLFVFSELCSAQQSTIKDFMPFAVGAKWKYYFVTDSYNSMVHYSSHHEGYVEYAVQSQTSTYNGKIWNIFQRRDYTSNAYVGYSWITQYLKDSTNFAIYDIDGTYHELYTPTFIDDSGFPFQQVTADTSKFYRYMPESSADNITRVINYPDTGNPPYYAHYVYNLKKDTGIVKLNYSHSSMNYSSTSQYTLDSYIKIYSEPFLGILKKNISLSTLFGTPKDTTIIIRNDGQITLNIYSVTSSNSKFTIQDYSRNIAPTSNGFIKIRFLTNQEETVSGVINISSNSLGGDASFTVLGTAIKKIIMQTDPVSYISFGSVINNTTKSLPLDIYNKGNELLRIDSIKISDKTFSVKYTNASIAAGEVLNNIIYFAPKTTAEHQTWIYIYSNAVSSPVMIELHAYSYEEIKYQINLQSIYFGIIKPGEHKDTTITIINNGKEPVYVSFFWMSHFYDGTQSWLFNFANSTIGHDKTLNPGETLTDVLRFCPTGNSMANDELTVRFMSPYSSALIYETIILTGNICFNLDQNFPNPFNNSTKISFTIANETNVKLKVYDLLGREVATVVNEQLKRGNYVKTFNASGLSSGIYFYHLSAGEFKQTKKFILLK
jgi:hypothetical protein